MWVGRLLPLLLPFRGDILDFTKLDHGAVELQKEPVCMRKAIESCMEIVAPEAERKGLALCYTTDDEAVQHWLVTDAVRLRQVLTNMLSNAVKFTESGRSMWRCPPSQPRSVIPAPTLGPLPPGQLSPPQRGRLPGSAGAVGGGGGSQQLLQQYRATRRSIESQQAGRHPAAAADAHPPFAGPLGSGQGLGGSSSRVSSRAGTEQGGQQGGQGGRGGPRRVHMRVRDTGIGVTPELVDRLFQCFRQGSETMARRYGGTGLGLAISRHLAELMEGSVWLETAAAGGAGTMAAGGAQAPLPPALNPAAGTPASEAGLGSSMPPLAGVPWGSVGQWEGGDVGGVAGVPREVWGSLQRQSLQEAAVEQCGRLQGRRVLVDLLHAGTAQQ
ncbi:histidine kinase-DNA gyrase B-and HSP90-like ATPase-domain-containing protein, partial [Haematococcus lacustris]